jgi:hypothetical protein
VHAIAFGACLPRSFLRYRFNNGARARIFHVPQT